MYDLLRPGALLLATIGIDGHGLGEGPLDFLTWSEEDYRRAVGDNCVGYPQNRLRAHEWERLFRDVGLANVAMTTTNHVAVPDSVAALYPEGTLLSPLSVQLSGDKP